MKKFLIVSVGFFLIFFSVFLITYYNWGSFSGWVVDSDYYHHWSLANGHCPERFYVLETCLKYPPLYSKITAFISWNEWLFNIFPMIISIFIIPWIIYKRTNSSWSLLIYYSSSVVFNIFFASIFPQMLFLLFFTIILYFKKFNLFRDGAIGLLSVFAHHQAIYVVIFLLVFKIFSERIDQIKIPFLVPFLSFPFSGKPDDQAGWDYFLIFSPLINWYYTFKLSKSKILAILFFFFGAYFLNYRVLLFIPVLWAFWLPELINKFNTREKLVLALIYSIWGLIQFLYFYLLTNPSVPIS